MVENQVGNNVKVEYAADLNDEQKKYLDHPWNFANF
jgi:hypothetical protein